MVGTAALYLGCSVRAAAMLRSSAPAMFERWLAQTTLDLVGADSGFRISKDTSFIACDRIPVVKLPKRSYGTSSYTVYHLGGRH